MLSIKRLARRSSWLALALSFSTSLLVPAVMSTQASAASLLPTNRQVTPASDLVSTLSTDGVGNPASPGTPYNGAKTQYTIKFNTTSNDTAGLGSIALFFCQTPFAGTTCSAPTGMDLTHVATGTVSGTSVGTGWAADTSTVANTGYFTTPTCGGVSPYRLQCVLLKATSAGTPTSGTTVTVVVSSSVSASDYVINPTAASGTAAFYVRIAAFKDTAYGTINDEGAAAFAIVSNTIDITSKVQEQLTFTVGVTPTNPGTTCAALSGGGALAIGDTNGALSTSTPYDGRSYWRVYTNASNGTSVLYAADTLKTTTGYSIAPQSTAGAISIGQDRFGLGMDTTDTAPGGNAGWGYTLSTLSPAANLGSASGSVTAASVYIDTTSASSPKPIASQGTAGPITCETGSVRYIASASTTTKPGIYRTSVAYIATPMF